MSATQLVQPSDLPKLIGYKHLFDAYGWPKRTIQEWVKARKFPKPCDLPGRENVWHLQDILDYLEQRRKGLVAHAIAHPEDLKPEQLDAIAFDRLKQIVSEQAGHDIDMNDVRIQYRPHVETSDEELEGQLETTFDAIEQQFDHLAPAESQVVAAWLFPHLRRLFEWPNAGVAREMNDPEQLRSLASKLIDPARKVRFLEELEEARENGSLDQLKTALLAEQPE